jgi:hypothetical protein
MSNRGCVVLHKRDKSGSEDLARPGIRQPLMSFLLSQLASHQNAIAMCGDPLVVPPKQIECHVWRVNETASLTIQRGDLFDMLDDNMPQSWIVSHRY